MNKIFKTKYDVTTGQTKVVSELASNRQLASSSEKTLKCGGISGSFLGLFKLLPLAFLLTGSFVYGKEINIVLSGLEAEKSKIGPSEILDDKGGTKTTPFIDKVGYKSILLAPGSKSLISKKTRNWGFAGDSIAIDTNNWMHIQKTVVIGHRARSNGNNAVAIGEQAFAASNSTSLGSEAIAYGNETVALGMQSYAEQTDDVALGHLAYAKGSLSTALGAHSSVESQKAVAIGYGAKVDHQHTDAIALGAESEADSPSSGSLMITKDDKTETKEKTWISEEFAKNFTTGKLGGVLSIGKKDKKYRQIVNVAPGTEDTHAVNLGQLREAMKNAGGGGVSYFSVNKLKAETNKNNDGAKAEHSLAIGVAETEMSKGMYSIVIGTANDDGTNTSNGNSQFTKSSGKAAVAIGSIATVEADYGIALGKMAKIHTGATAAIALGKEAEAKAAGAVAIGEGASVSTNAGDSIALGKNSVAENKKTVATSQEVNVGENSLKFDWKNGDVGADKSVVSVGNKGNERVITNVAAGEVRDGSTDAINGSQLYSVIDEFGKLGVNVLGAEVDENTKKFKQTTFTKLKNENGQDGKVVAATTFKEAIEKSIETINKGLKFAGDNGGDKQLYLGSTLTIKGADTVSATSGPSTSTPTHKNISTTSKEGGILEIALNENLKEITSIVGKNAGGDTSKVSKIEFNSTASGGNGSTPNVKITADGGEFTFGKDGLNLNSKQITGIASGLGLQNGTSTGSGSGGNGNASIIKKVLAGDPDKDNNNGNKIANNAVNVNDLSQVAKALVEKGLSFEGNSGGSISRKLGETLKIVGETSATTPTDSTQPATETAPGNITVAKKNGSEDTLEVKLSKNLKGIASIANGENAKIALEDKTITFTSGDKSTGVTLKGSTLSGVSEINKEANKGALKLDNATATLESAKDKSKLELKDSEAKLESAKDKSKLELKDGEAKLESAKDGSKVELKDKEVTLESAKDNSKVELKDKAVTLESAKDNSKLELKENEATLSAGEDKGSIKVTNGTNNKIELSPEKDATVTLVKDGTNNTVKATGLSTIGKNDSNALVFKDGNTAELKVGGNALTFTKSDSGNTVKISNVAVGNIATDSKDAITGKQLSDLAGKLGATVNAEKTGFDEPTFTAVIGVDQSKKPATFKSAIDDLITAVNKGLIFKGNENKTTTTMQLGGTLTLDSSESKTKTAGLAEKDIKISVTPNGADPKEAGTIKLSLNKATTVEEGDERIVTSKAVADKLKEYTTSETLEDEFLRIDGSNIDDKQKKFGENVGISEIKLDGGKSSTELVQAQAVIDYLKGHGDKSVKVSDSPTTEALGEGSVSVGHGAISKNEGSIAMGYGANALNTGAVSIGQDSNVLGMSSIGIGRENTVRGNFSFAVGDNNVIEKEQNYVMGSDNKITGKQNISIGSRNEVEGNENIILGSNITADDEIHNAIVLGTGSLAKSDALSVGSMRHKRKIVFVADPTDNYDAANKKYVDERGLKFKGNESGQTELVNLDKLLTIDSSEAKDDKGTKEKDIKTKVEKEGDGAKLTLTLNKADEVSEHDERAVSSKAVHSALQAAKAEADKTAVKYDDPTKSSITLGGKSAKNYRPVAIDNLKSGLGIDDIKDVGITSAAQGKQGKLVKDLVAGKLDTTKDARGKEIDNLHKAVNLADLKAVAQAGLNFAGNDEQDIHKNLGEKLDIVGQGLTKDTVANFKGTNGNIAVKADSTKTKLEVSLNEDLTGLKSAEFKGKDGNTVKIDGDAIVLNDKDSKPIATLNKDGLTINGKDGKSAVSLTTKNDNGKDAATLEFAKEGEQGTGAITGLKDLEDNADGSSATNKNYVDNQLKKAKEDADKTAVKYDDDSKNAITLGGKDSKHQPVVIDNLRSGLGIDDINDGGIASIKQGKTRDLVKDLVAGKLDEKAHKAANVSDLKALATAGLNFAGNDAKDIHKNLGETLAIVGQSVTDIALFKGTNNNIAVKTVAGNLEVSLNEALTAIKSLVTQAKSVDDKSGLSAISTLDGAGLHLTPAESLTNGQGKQADYGLLGSTVKDGEKTNTQTAAGNTLSDDKGNRATYDRHGVSLQDKDSNTAKLDAQGLTVGDKNSDADKTHSVYGKEGLTIHGKDGKSAVSLTTKNDNGKDAATLAFAKGEDGQAGTGAITGLKDLEANADGSSAANKNYVDNQLRSALEEVAGNRPFDYYLNDIKVSKDKDGNFYKKEESGKKVKLTDAEKAQVVIKAEPQSTPMTVSNIKAAKLETDSTDAVNGAQLVAATGALAGQDGKMTFADGRDGKAATDPTAAANQGLTAKDGLNGHNANDKANALRNGEAGSVVYTDSAGQRLVKANDGKYYHAADVENNGVPKDGKSAVENPQLSLVNTGGETDKPVVLGNVASGLGIDADKAKEHAENVKKAGEAVKTEAQAVAKKVDDMLTLQTAKEAKQDAIDALETALSFMPETTPEEKAAKEKAKAKIEGEKSTLADINSKLDKAKKEVESAQGILKTKQEAYQTALKAKDGAVNKLLSGDASVDVHRGANLQDLQALGQAGLNFEGNDGVPVHKNLGEKLTIKGEGEFNSATTAAGNIKVEASETGLEIKLSDTLKNMTSFETKETVEGNKSRLDGKGLRVTHKDGKSAHYGSDGVKLTDGKHGITLTSSGLTLINPQGQRIEIDGEKGEIRVPDLTPNSSPNTVVNKGYVDSLHSQTAHKLETTDKNLRAGIAGANAAAGLAVTSMPGTSMLSVSTATYDGQNAVAVGYSKMSDNGKIMLRLQGNSNSRGKTAGSVSVGYLW